MGRNYSDEEVEAILRRALETQAAAGDGYEHEDLVAAAREVGLDDASVVKAVQEIQAERDREAIRARLTKKLREGWLRHFVTYAVVIGALLGLNVLGYIGALAVWAAFGWGIGIALHTFSAIRGATDEQVDKEQRKLNRKQRRKAAAEARREKKRQKTEARKAQRRRKKERREAGDELERVIEEGVNLLLATAANKLREASREMNPPVSAPQSDFQQYVADRKAGRRPDHRAPVVTPAPKTPAAPPRARVEIDEEEEHALESRPPRRHQQRR